MSKAVNMPHRMVAVVSLFLVASCGSESNSHQEDDPLSYSIEIRSHEDIEFDGARIRVVLVGYHLFVADIQATILSDDVMAIDRVPSTINLQWPENAYQLIDSPPVRVEEEAAFGFSVHIDASGDSVICEGEDFDRDYDESPLTSKYGMPSETVVIFVKPVTRESCVVF